jgi:hypothetical protein
MPRDPTWSVCYSMQQRLWPRGRSQCRLWRTPLQLSCSGLSKNQRTWQPVRRATEPSYHSQFNRRWPMVQRTLARSSCRALSSGSSFQHRPGHLPSSIPPITPQGRFLGIYRGPPFFSRRVHHYQVLPDATRWTGPQLTAQSKIQKRMKKS